VHTSWKTTALAATVAAGLALTACSSSHSPSPATSSASRSGAGGLKAVSNCLRSHGADASSLDGLLSGSPITATSAQLAAVRAASRACDSTVPAKLERGLSSTVSCLDRHGYHLDAHAPLSALFSLDLSRSTVVAAITDCSAALSTRAPKPAGS
jgi:hypothetical protein